MTAESEMPWTPRVAVVEFVAPGGAAANAGKMRDGITRFDTIPIAQGLRNAGAAVDRVRYDASFLEVARVYDALVLRATSHVVSEFNCSCVGVSAFYAAAGPDRDLADVKPADVKAGMDLCDLVGRHVVRAVRDRAARDASAVRVVA